MALDLAFCLYRVMPFGGLERNALELARAARARGHRVSVYTRRFEGEREAGLEIHELPVKAWTNIGLDRAFARAVTAEAKAPRRMSAPMSGRRDTPETVSAPCAGLGRRGSSAIPRR